MKQWGGMIKLKFIFVALIFSVIGWWLHIFQGVLVEYQIFKRNAELEREVESLSIKVDTCKDALNYVTILQEMGIIKKENRP